MYFISTFLRHPPSAILPPPSVNGGSDALPLWQSLRSLSVYGSGDPCGGCLGHEALGTGILPSGPEQEKRADGLGWIWNMGISWVNRTYIYIYGNVWTYAIQTCVISFFQSPFGAIPFSDKFIYIYIELNSKKHYSRFIFTEEENYSVVITICRKISHTFPCKWEALRISKKHTQAIDHWISFGLTSSAVSGNCRWGISTLSTWGDAMRAGNPGAIPFIWANHPIYKVSNLISPIFDRSNRCANHSANHK